MGVLFIPVSSIRVQVEGPWEDGIENRRAIDTLRADLRVENGVRLAVANLNAPGTGVLAEQDLARSQVELLL